MRLGTFLSSSIKSELENLIKNCNFTEEEEVIVKLLAAGKSHGQISDATGYSLRTISRRVKNLKAKIGRWNKIKSTSGKL